MALIREHPPQPCRNGSASIIVRNDSRCRSDAEFREGDVELVRGREWMATAAVGTRKIRVEVCIYGSLHMTCAIRRWSGVWVAEIPPAIDDDEVRIVHRCKQLGWRDQRSRHVTSVGPYPSTNAVGFRYAAIMTTVHLIDGTYELFRSHFGAPPRQTPQGWEIGAVHGIVSSTLNLLSDPEATHVGAAFDTVIESFRNDMYDGYKTGEGTPPELFDQFPVAERAMEAIGVTVWSMIEQEADDGLAAAAMKYVDEVDRVIILSPDKDMTQLFSNPKIVGFDRRNQKLVDADGVMEKFGVQPASIPDYLGLVGDTADGFPGLPGWGAKSASTMLARYGTIERIPASEEDWDVKVRGAAKLAATLREQRELALLFKDIATLRTDADIPQTLEELRWKGAHKAAFHALCDELGFDSIKNRATKWADD